MNTSQSDSEHREILPEDIDKIIVLLDALRSEIHRCEDVYFNSQKGSLEFNLDYWYNRLLLPSNLCADIVTLSNSLLREIFYPGEDYKRNFSGTEHIFTMKPTSSEVFLQSIKYMRSLLIPLALLYLHAAKNPANQVSSNKLITDITGMIAGTIRVRGEYKEMKAWEAIDKGKTYFSEQVEQKSI